MELVRELHIKFHPKSAFEEFAALNELTETAQSDYVERILSSTKQNLEARDLDNVAKS